ncbi:hypothetical protein GCM10015535_48270 [Streptomyces gelaticus]|uniref:Uncharacterized protein n=1 Tax=Streptomyces gelaticus TaxID=285446 RepID=A0ABQ2W3F5_9ACTN|nr:hypothetical protein GCM10015535_48270 [Streptomyces gelaticus]
MNSVTDAAIESDAWQARSVPRIAEFVEEILEGPSGPGCQWWPVEWAPPERRNWKDPAGDRDPRARKAQLPQ